MPSGQELPLADFAGTPWFEVSVPLNVAGVISGFLFEFRFNDEDLTFYVDVYDADGTTIANGIRIVLGVYLGSRYDHQLFRRGVLVAIDTSGTDTEAGLSDLGSRVKLVYFSDLAVMIGRRVMPGLVPP